MLRSRLSGAYLGLLFYDGPEPEKLHYRIYSAALRFVPEEELAASGLGRYLAQSSPPGAGTPGADR
ncbi:Peptide methionine sulfoxide reductase MsrB [compost metagenome]